MAITNFSLAPNIHNFDTIGGKSDFYLRFSGLTSAAARDFVT